MHGSLAEGPMSAGVRSLEPPVDGSRAGLRPFAVGVDVVDVARPPSARPDTRRRGGRGGRER